MDRFCSNCHSLVAPGEAFCAQCAEPVPTPPPAQQVQDSSSPAPASTTGRGPWILVSAVAVLVAAGAVAFAMTSPTATVPPVSAPVSFVPRVLPTKPVEESLTPRATMTPTPASTPALAKTPQQAIRLSTGESRSQLRQRQRRDRSQLTALRNSWAPQVSSKCEGLDNVDLGPGWFPDGNPDTDRLTAQKILAFHLSLAGRDGALTVTDKDVGDRMVFAACAGRTMWMAMIPRSFRSAEAANRWCENHSYPIGECAARYVVGPGRSGAEVKWRT